VPIAALGNAACQRNRAQRPQRPTPPSLAPADRVSPDTPRLLINRERVGQRTPTTMSMGLGGLDFEGDAPGRRDALFLGNCDDGVLRLAELLGWDGELGELIGSWPQEAVGGHEG
jgi:hypothetical protein